MFTEVKGKKNRKKKNLPKEFEPGEKKEEIPNHLLCPQCKEMFVIPTLLPCMDTFCHECLLKLIPEPEPQANNQAAPPEGNNQAVPQDGAAPPVAEVAPPPVEPVVEQKPPDVMVACPTCQKEVKADTIKNEELPIQYLFQNEIEAYKSREAGGPRCGECIEQNEVVGYCITCSLSMCQECQRSHQRLTKFVNHKIKNADQVSEDQLLKGCKKYCDAHNNEFELRYFCTNTECKKLICSECKDSKKHRTHEVFLASDVLDDTKVLVDGKINIGNNASKNLHEFLKVSEKVVQQSEVDKNKSICAIEQSFTSLENMLKEQKKKLIEQITQNHEAGKKSLEKGKIDASTLRKLLDYAAMALDAAGLFGNIEVITELGKQIEQMYEHLAVDQINETAITIPADGVAANEPTVEVFGVLNTIFNQNKGNVSVQVTKKTVTAKTDALTTITNTCKQAMELFNQN